MKKIVPAFLFATFVLGACSKDHVDNLPEANFSIQLPNNKMDTASTIVWPTWVRLHTINNSATGATYSWDNGARKTSTTKEPIFVYEAAGEYELTLRVTKDGQEKSYKKKIIAIDRRLIAVTVTELNWNNSFSNLLNWPANQTADVFLRIYRHNGAGLPTLINDAYQAEVLYESPVRAGVTMSNAPFSLSIPAGLPLQHPEAKSTYGYCLYAKAQGQEHLLLSNWGSGVGNLFQENFTVGQSITDLSFNGTSVRLHAEYAN